jgi:hypothetical protein
MEHYPASSRAPASQENAQLASTKLEVLGTMGVQYKRFKTLPVLAASSKRVEAREITAGCFFLSLICFVGTEFRQYGRRSCFTLFNDTLHRTLGERIGALPWTGRFNGSPFVKECPSGIAPNRLEAHGVDGRFS